MSDRNPLTGDLPVSRLLAHHSFNDQPIATIEYGGHPVWTAGQIAKALGYSRTDHVADKVASDWSTDLIEGTDYLVLRGAELAAVKAAAPELVGARAKSLMVLKESGVFGVTLLCRLPAGVALRRCLADEVLPAIRKTGSYDPNRSLRQIVAQKIGDYALEENLRYGVADPELPKRLDYITRAANALLSGDCTTIAEVAKHGRMRTMNACWGVQHLQRMGVAVPTDPTARRMTETTWSLVGPADQRRQIEARP